MNKEIKDEGLQSTPAFAKLPVMPRLFAITTQDGWNEIFWDKDKAQHKIDTEYKKDFPNEEFWIEEVRVS
jgi:hypothetical protein